MLKKAESGVRSLFAAIADAPGLIRLDDPIYREQMALLGRQRAELSASIPVLEERLRAGPVAISEERIAIFSRTVRDRLRSADPSFRRQWLHLFVDEVVISRSEIVISGRNDTLLNGVTDRPDFFGPAVPSFDQEWRARQGIDRHCDRWRIALQHPAAPPSPYTEVIGRSICDDQPC